MSLILNIDTSSEKAGVSISKNGIILATIINEIQKDHAAFLHNAIKELLAETAKSIKELDAVAVTNGPGSYTGLRVGLASAKGFCYALKIPLITIGTLNMLAAAAINISKKSFISSVLYCPLIDARRKEVYTALFDNNLNEVLPACALILDESSFKEVLQDKQVIFFGSGALKWSKIVKSENACFIFELDTIHALCDLSYNKFIIKDFTDLPFSEPLYIKEFFYS